MAQQNFKKGTTSKLGRAFIQNATSGAPITGLVFNSLGLQAYYIKEGDSSTTSMSLVAGTLGTWISGGFKEIDSVNMPGMYEVDAPNAAISSGNSCIIYLQGYSGMSPCIVMFQLDAVDNQNGVTGGLSALPSVAAGASGGLPTGNASGQVSLNMTQTVPTSNTAQTTGDSLNAARAEGFGKWTVIGTTLTLYAGDNTTIVRTFTLDSSTSPTQRI